MCWTPWAFPHDSQHVSLFYSRGYIHSPCGLNHYYKLEMWKMCEFDNGGWWRRRRCNYAASNSEAKMLMELNCILWQHISYPTFPEHFPPSCIPSPQVSCFLLFSEVQGWHAWLQQCLHPHNQCNHNQPRPAVDGAAHSHHLHVQPVLTLPPLRPSLDQRARAAGPQPTGSARGHPLHWRRQRPTQERRTGEDKMGSWMQN